MVVTGNFQSHSSVKRCKMVAVSRDVFGQGGVCRYPAVAVVMHVPLFVDMVELGVNFFLAN